MLLLFNKDMMPGINTLAEGPHSGLRLEVKLQLQSRERLKSILTFKIRLGSLFNVIYIPIISHLNARTRVCSALLNRSFKMLYAYFSRYQAKL